MQALTSERVREHFTPGDTIRDIHGDVHTAFKIMHTGYGFAGVVLTTRSLPNKSLTYCLWVVKADGAVRCTMSTGDFPAENGGLIARITEAARETGMGEVTA